MGRFFRYSRKHSSLYGFGSEPIFQITAPNRHNGITEALRTNPPAGPMKRNLLHRTRRVRRQRLWPLSPSSPVLETRHCPPPKWNANTLRASASPFTIFWMCSAQASRAMLRACMKTRGGALYPRGRGTYERLELMGQMWAKIAGVAASSRGN